MPIEIFNKAVVEGNGAEWMPVSEATTSPILRVEFQSSAIPESWEQVGYVYQLTMLGNVLHVLERHRIPANRAQFIKWQLTNIEYYIQVRLVKWIREGTLLIDGYEVRELPVFSGEPPDERVITKFLPNDQTSLFRVQTADVSGIRYWRSNAGPGDEAHVFIVLKPEFIAGKYDVFVNGLDESNGLATMKLYLNGAEVYSRVANSPFNTLFEVKVLENVSLLPNYELKIALIKEANERGSVSSITLKPS